MAYETLILSREESFAVITTGRPPTPSAKSSSAS